MKHFIAIFMFCVLAFQLKSQASFTVSQGYCIGGTFTLSANTGTLANCTFTWSSQPAGVLFGSPNNSISSIVFSTTAQYTLMLTVASGSITSIAQQTINITTFPMFIFGFGSVACVTSNNPNSYKTLTLTATGATTYSWTSNPPMPINGSGSAMVTVTPTTATCFTVNGSQDVCTSSSSLCFTLQPQFSVQVSPSATVICIAPIGGPSVFADLSVVNPTPTVNGPFTYTWWPTLGLITSRYIQNVKALPLTTTDFTVEVKDSNGCVSLPAIATVSVENCLGLGIRESTIGDIVIHPNPVVDHVTIIMQRPDENATLRLLDGVGRLLLSWNSVPTSVDLSTIPSGIYYLFVQSPAGRKIVSLVKQ